MDWIDETELEWSYAAEADLLAKGAGEIFEGEAVQAIAKALLQSGVSYIGGYQGAPVAYLMDCLAQAQPLLDELGVHFQACANEASAAAMLGASVNYRARGCAIWKSVAGTAVASDALSNLATAGVQGGVLIVVGADFGEGSNVGQERTQASAMKSQIWLLDPKPDLPTITRLVEKGFELSEASNSPVILELRIRASHLHGRFVAKDNRAPAISANDKVDPQPSDYGQLVLPPSTFAQEQDKLSRRLPAAQDFVLKEGLNELVDGSCSSIGIIIQGGLYNAVLAAMRELGLADVFGNTEIPHLVLNVTYPLVDSQIADFCLGKRAVLIVEESQPDYIEQAVNVILRRRDINSAVVGKGVFPAAGEYTAQIVLQGLAEFFRDARPETLDTAGIAHTYERLTAAATDAPLADENLARPPGFCTGCPERPVFSAMKLLKRELGDIHLSADIGCHLYSSLPPFNMANTVMGYGLGLASSQGVEPLLKKRVVSSMGDGGFWHNGLNSSVASALFNKDDSVLVIFENGYTSSTGAQSIPSSRRNFLGQPSALSIENTLKGIGVKWVRKLRSYDVRKMVKTLRKAMTTNEPGLKVIIAEGECQLAVQRRTGPGRKRAIADGKRVIRERFGVDDDVCTGDHSCIRLSGCPSLTVKPNPDALRTDPVAHVNQNCVGCGLCGEVAHAAILCPSFYKARIIHNPGRWDRLLARLRDAAIGYLQNRRMAKALVSTG